MLRTSWLLAGLVLGYLTSFAFPHKENKPTTYNVLTTSDVPLFDGKPHVLGDAEHNFYIIQYDSEHHKLIIELLIIGDDHLPLPSSTPVPETGKIL